MNALESYKDAAADVILTSEWSTWYSEVKRILKSDWSDWRVDLATLSVPLSILTALYAQNPKDPYDACNTIYDYYYYYHQR